MWEAYRTIDETLWRISGRIRILKGVNPTQASVEQARERFFRARQEGGRADVRLAYYPPQSNLGALGSALEQAEVPEGPLGALYEAKRQDLLAKVRLLSSVGTSELTSHSLAVYGRPTPEVVRRAEQFLSEHPPHAWAPREVPASVMKERFSQALSTRGLDDWRVVLRTEGVVGVSINHRRRAIEIHADRFFDEPDVARLIVHEVDTHILRRSQAELTGIRLFAVGTAGYLATEEGLAVFQEAQQGVLEVNRLRVYAGQLLAVNTALVGGFEAVFESLLARGFSDDEAFHITLRVKRGFSVTEEPGAFTKDHSYYTGMCAVEAFVEAGGRIEELFILGKIGIEDLPLLRRMGLVSAMRDRATA
jgi:hypothetical protein